MSASRPADRRSEPPVDGATAVAHSNIALIKYWGKRDEALHLPVTSSLSLTLDAHPTTTSVRFLPERDADAAAGDEVVLDGATAAGRPRERVVRFLDRVRDLAGIDARARVVSRNTAPTAAGLASSAAGFAALAAAASRAAGLDLDPRALSVLARKGSGSASRSIFGGLAIWHAGHDDASSYAEPVVTAADTDPARALDLAMVIAVADDSEKEVSSSEAMRRTVETSPFFGAWEAACAADLRAMLRAIGDGDIATIGSIAESNAMRMHATMLGADPPVSYWAPASVALLRAVRRLREQGLGCWATMDAGPNVKVLCRGAERASVAAALREAVPDARVTEAGPGPGVRVDDGAQDAVGGSS